MCFLGLLLATVIHVNAAHKLGSASQVWGFFGYDEPNYTYTPNGSKLIGELGALAPKPVYIRTHFLLATGDGKPALKWGSTNAYTEDANGKPVYGWSIIDRIFDTYLHAGAKPFVEIGFMPQALSTHPEPYRHEFPKSNFTGWSYPPRDYAKWQELIYEFAKHCATKYGLAEASSWYWEVWNEPDIQYWHGTPEEYDQLYDVSVAAVKRALPQTRVGGPASTGPASDRARSFLYQFLAHCDKTNVPLDFISFHAKGKPSLVDGHVHMNLAAEVADAQQGFSVVHRFPKFASLPIVLSEADPEGCAACSAQQYPQNAYRNGPLYATYTATAIDSLTKIAQMSHVNLAGMLTWAFEFEGQPYFAGFRDLATNGIDKPILNLFRMLGLMRGPRVEADEGIAAADDHGISVLLWNYSADDLPGKPRRIDVEVSGTADRSMLQHYRIDETHSNAYAAWLKMGSPQQPTPEQFTELERSGQLELLESPRWISSRDGRVSLSFDLPQNAVSLLQFNW